jgi:hypothetical protein
VVLVSPSQCLYDFAMADRDHLFISYAWEDQVFARWLALKLTAEGYKVWIDQFKLLGGESWPTDIDEAIKTRTFRMLGLLSKHSLHKPNPKKERTLALSIAKQPGRAGFLIPLNVDGLQPVELDWLTSDLTFIPFMTSWHKGLQQLLKLLDREQCPRGEVDKFRAIVSRVASASEFVKNEPETLISNACEFSQIPAAVSTYAMSPSLADVRHRDAMRDWAFYTITPQRVVAFHPPGDELSQWFTAHHEEEFKWSTTREIEGVATENIVTALLRRCIETRCRERGFLWDWRAEAYCCNLPLAKNLSVAVPDGKKTVAQSSGQRTFFRVGAPKTFYRYWLAVNPTVARNLFDEFTITWRVSLHFTDIKNQPLPVSVRNSRRKNTTKNWRNWHWIVRHLGIVQYLAAPDNMIRVGPEGPQQVVLDCSPLTFLASKSIDDDKIGPPEVVDEDAPVEEEPEDEVSDGQQG